MSLGSAAFAWNSQRLQRCWHKQSGHTCVLLAVLSDSQQLASPSPSSPLAVQAGAAIWQGVARRRACGRAGGRQGAHPWTCFALLLLGVVCLPCTLLCEQKMVCVPVRYAVAGLLACLAALLSQPAKGCVRSDRGSTDFLPLQVRATSAWARMHGQGVR